MNIRLLGAALVVAGCGAVGFSIAAGYRREERALQALLFALEHIICELRYRMTALPELCAGAGKQAGGPVGGVLVRLSQLLAQQAFTDPAECMDAALENYPKLPQAVRRNLLLLGNRLGRFDAAGQLQGLESVKELVQRDITGLRSGLDGKLRACRTLGLCAGAALAILLI